MTLPPLPLPAHTFYPKRGKYQTFSADQMRAYGEACAAAYKADAERWRKPLTDRQVIALWADRSDGPANHEIISFARAIERAYGIGGTP